MLIHFGRILDLIFEQNTASKLLMTAFTLQILFLLLCLLYPLHNDQSLVLVNHLLRKLLLALVNDARHDFLCFLLSDVEREVSDLIQKLVVGVVLSTNAFGDYRAFLALEVVRHAHTFNLFLYFNCVRCLD